MKSRGGKNQRREEKRRREEERRSEKRKSQKKEDAGARKSREVAKHCFFHWFVGSLKRLMEPSGEMRNEKFHAVVAWSTFASQNAQNTPRPEHLWKLRWWKSAHRELRTQTQPLVAKHIGGTIRAQNDRSRTRRTDEVPFIGGCSHFTRKNTRFGAPASSPKHSPCNIHAAITMRFATSRGKPAPIYARGNIKWRQWSSDSNAICNQRFKNRIELCTQTQPLVAKHIGGTIRGKNDRSRTRRTDEVYLSSPAAATLHGKTEGFVLRLPPQNKAHATFMQPLQCGSQHQLANLHLSTHRTTPEQNDNSHAAIPMRSASTDSKTPYSYAHTSTLKAAWSHRYTAAKKKTTNRPQPHPSHRRGTFHRRLQPLYTEKHKVSCSGFLPKTKPMQHSCSHYNAVRSINSQTCTYLRTEQHQNTKWQQSCSHSNAICKHRFQNTL